MLPDESGNINRHENKNSLPHESGKLSRYPTNRVTGIGMTMKEARKFGKEGW